MNAKVEAAALAPAVLNHSMSIPNMTDTAISSQQTPFFYFFSSFVLAQNALGKPPMENKALTFAFQCLALKEGFFLDGMGLRRTSGK
jgi:hypothetical protein